VAELQPQTHEHGREANTHELERTAAENLKKIHEQSLETNTNHEHQEQQKRTEAAREALRHEDEEQKAPEAPPAEAAPRHRIAAMLNQRLNYTQTLASLQRRLTPAGRTFSRVIHNPVVEKASEALETTIARPSIMAGSTWTALIIGSVFYFTARRYGYNLSGSEIDVSFLLGAAIGLILEWLWRTVLRRPKR
jgi:hypothetical protein